MPSEPSCKNAIVFFDGQNLFHTARQAFGYTYPNYDVLKLAQAVCSAHGWQLKQTRFYTGIPAKEDNEAWHHFWSTKLLALSRQKVYTFSRPLRYRNKVVKLPDGSQHSFPYAEEKGIDVRIALDVLKLAIEGKYDVGLIFSQDQDLSEAAKEIRRIAREDQRWIKVASAYPNSPTSTNRRGIDGTDWVKIDRSMYDACIDPHDYRPKKKSP